MSFGINEFKMVFMAYLTLGPTPIYRIGVPRHPSYMVRWPLAAVLNREVVGISETAELATVFTTVIELYESNGNSVVQIA